MVFLIFVRNILSFNIAIQIVFQQIFQGFKNKKSRKCFKIVIKKSLTSLNADFFNLKVLWCIVFTVSVLLFIS